jgi:predicted nucleic acid-binding protein
LLFRENISIYEVTQEDYIKAALIAENHDVRINDALAYALMKKQAVQAIYSFDKDLDAFNDIQRANK